MPAVQPPSKDENKRIQVTTYRVKYKDIFVMKEFYQFLHEWLAENTWTDMEDGKDHYETLYLEKVDMDGAKEVWIKWRPQKIPEKNSYYRYWLDFDFHILGLKSTEIVKEGKKLKVDKGEMELFVTAYIDLDYEGKWSEHPILKFFNVIFPERIFRKEIYEDKKKELYREAYALQNEIKQWFKMKRYLPYEEIKSFHPSFAWPSHVKEE